jgi:hypothetical protein
MTNARDVRGWDLMISPSADGVAPGVAKTVIAVVSAALVVVLLVVGLNVALTVDRPLSAAERLERVQNEFGDGWTCEERTPESYLCWTLVPGSIADLRTCNVTLTADRDVKRGECVVMSLESGAGGFP